MKSRQIFATNTDDNIWYCTTQIRKLVQLRSEPTLIFRLIRIDTVVNSKNFDESTDVLQR